MLSYQFLATSDLTSPFHRISASCLGDLGRNTHFVSDILGLFTFTGELLRHVEPLLSVAGFVDDGIRKVIELLLCQFFLAQKSLVNQDRPVGEVKLAGILTEVAHAHGAFRTPAALSCLLMSSTILPPRCSAVFKLDQSMPR